MKPIIDYTDEQIEVLPAGPELDGLAAMAMGWPHVGFNRDGYAVGISPGGNQMTDAYAAVPAYSSDGNAMLATMEWLAQHCDGFYLSEETKSWEADGYFSHEELEGEYRIKAKGENAPLAIARAVARAGRRIVANR